MFEAVPVQVEPVRTQVDTQWPEPCFRVPILFGMLNKIVKIKPIGKTDNLFIENNIVRTGVKKKN